MCDMDGVRFEMTIDEMVWSGVGILVLLCAVVGVGVLIGYITWGGC